MESRFKETIMIYIALVDILTSDVKTVASLQDLTHIVESEDSEIVEIDADIYEYLIGNEAYYLNGKFELKPQRSTMFDIWDSVNKEWKPNLKMQLQHDKEEAIGKRNLLLQESDWTDTVSAQSRLHNYDEWQVYRQELRDIPLQSGYPTDISWPVPPA